MTCLSDSDIAVALLISAWRKGYKLGWVMVNLVYPEEAFEMRARSYDEWNMLHAKAGDIYKPFRSGSADMEVRRFIATRFVNANNALWDGNMDLARKWMLSGKDVKNMKNDVRAAARVAMHDAKHTRYVSARAGDKWHDWAAVK